MKQEDKQLLIQDLCSRLPYGVKVQVTKVPIGLSKDETLTYNRMYSLDESDEYITIKPYLRPMSSMTEEEMIDFLRVTDLSKVSKKFINDFKSGNFGIMVNISNYARNIDWLNKKMFDYRGLIPRGLAIDADEFILLKKVKS